MSFIECPECGHKALSVATRCPRCGHAFPSRPLVRPGTSRHRDWPSVLLTGVIVLGAVVVVGTLRWPGRQHPAKTDSTAMATPAAPQPGAPKPSPATPASRAAADTVHGSLPQLTRYARTWVNVRDARARAAASVRVLSPGEAVLVDSLHLGWYRVLADGRPLGYVHRSNLDAAPPPAP